VAKLARERHEREKGVSEREFERTEKLREKPDRLDEVPSTKSPRDFVESGGKRRRQRRNGGREGEREKPYTPR